MHTLIVEDSKSVAVLLSTIVKKEDSESTIASTGKNAYEELVKNDYNLVLLDIELPDSNGLEILQRIRQQNNQNQLPVIVVSSKTEDSFILQALDKGANDYITKPFHELQLRVKIRNLLKMQQINTALEVKNKQFESIFSHSPLGISILNSKGDVEMRSNAYTLNLGFSETGGKQNFGGHIHPDDMPKVMKRFSDLLEGKTRTISEEIRVTTPEKRISYFHTTATLIKDKDDNPQILTFNDDITEAKLAEEALKESQAKYKRLVNNSSSLIMEVNADTYEIVNCNPSMAKALGQNVDNLIGKNIKDFLPDDIMQMRIECAEKALRENRVIRFEDERDGRYFLNNFIPHKVNKQRFIQTVTYDITELKNAELDLRQKNKEIEILLKGTRLVLESKDFLTTARRIFDYSKELTGAKVGYVALLNKNGEENDVIFLESGGLPCSVDPKLPMPIRGLREVVYKSGKTAYDNDYQNSLHVRYMPAGHMPLRNVLFAPLKEHGKVVGLLGLGQKESDFDEDDKKIATSFAELVSIALINSRNLDRLKINRDKYEGLYKSMNEGVCLHEMISNEKGEYIDYRIIDANPKYEETIGLSKKEIINKLASEIYPGDAPPFLKKYSSVVTTGKPISFQTYYEGYDKHFHISVFSPQKGQFATVFQDITEHKKALKALEESEVKYRELNATKDKFFSIISHDLRSPFHSILGFSEMILLKYKKNDHKKVNEYSKMIYDTTKNTYNLLENLLNWSRFQSNEIKFTPERIVLRQVVHNELLVLKSKCNEKEIDLSIEIADGLEVDADVFMLKTILRNLLSNAIKYTNSGGKINIRAAQKESVTLIEVADNGVGMDKKGLSKLFKIEESYSTPGTNHEPGTGLGLILCKEFVEKHRGEIWANSDLDRGTTFYFTIADKLEFL